MILFQINNDFIAEIDYTHGKECADYSDFRDSTILMMLKQELNRVELS